MSEHNTKYALVGEIDQYDLVAPDKPIGKYNGEKGLIFLLYDKTISGNVLVYGPQGCISQESDEVYSEEGLDGTKCVICDGNTDTSTAYPAGFPANSLNDTFDCESNYCLSMCSDCELLFNNVCEEIISRRPELFVGSHI